MDLQDTAWRVHWLEAEGDLSPWRERIAEEVEAARAAVARLLPPPRLDVIVQRLTGAVIPETGAVGHALRRGLFTLTVDPLNPNFAASLDNGNIRRGAVHEAHHCMRMGGPGYGASLGEALVTEGLAGQFVRAALGSPPEPWERAVDEDGMRAHLPDAAALAAAEYDHAAWFYGTGALPRWLGYALGYRIVGDWLAANDGIAGRTWIEAPARTVLATPGGILAKGPANPYGAFGHG